MNGYKFHTSTKTKPLKQIPKRLRHNAKERRQEKRFRAKHSQNPNVNERIEKMDLAFYRSVSMPSKFIVTNHV